MGITYKYNFDPKTILDRALKDMEPRLDKAMAEAVTEIDRRTQQGREITGKPFDSYSDSYSVWRAKKGYSSRPNLTVTGQMLAAMQSKVERTLTALIGRIFFLAGRTGGSTNDQIAKWNQETRPFFGLSDTQKKNIERKLKNK